MAWRGRIAGGGGVVVAALLVAANWRTGSVPAETRADSLVVWKAERRLALFAHGQQVKSYAVSLGRVPIGDKVQEGDRRTPEGLYRIDSRLEASAFHRALHVSYPDSADVAEAKARGVSPGGAIMIHGVRNGLGWLGRFQRLADWTAGCVALTNSEIEQLWGVVPDGTPIRIAP